ncbi:hypothetical protein [Flavobacterium sp. GT3R68]|uniref:hypothetical protein n=1 Tax=Flavobacterium sp. GT3R68 TaxID=2594437 RepID=UPI000F85DBEF|nr:hypothetical protein [Flavobacterium sp. GT3R68]RTY96022.1 hypothetical protein EKL32_05090 [Flavobacterium sp. GSN2]TRW93795.1 hypothetical protein FNW07_02480 [Flavobacterium sp. GT3R68]
MKIQFSYILLLLLMLTSCKEDLAKRTSENAKDAKKKDVIFENINKGWNFNGQPSNATSQSLANTWSEWRIFLNELSQKPKSTMGAFQKKAKTLSVKVTELNNNIPATYSKPAVKSRIGVLTTKINSLNLYINLDEIPIQKVLSLISEINIELASLQAQFDEIVRKNLIPKEEGESDLIKMLDTSRAVPTTKIPE